MCMLGLAFDSLKKGWCQCCGWIRITSWIIRSFRDSNEFDFAVYSMYRKSLASTNDTNRRWTRMGHFDIKCLGELCSRITEKFNHGAANFLIRSPRLHYCRIIDAVY